jgi:hypothetical protein
MSKRIPRDPTRSGPKRRCAPPIVGARWMSERRRRCVINCQESPVVIGEGIPHIDKRKKPATEIAGFEMGATGCRGRIAMRHVATQFLFGNPLCALHSQPICGLRAEGLQRPASGSRINRRRAPATAKRARSVPSRLAREKRDVAARCADPSGRSPRQRLVDQYPAARTTRRAKGAFRRARPACD